MDNEIEVKILKLVQRLYAKSRAGEIKWERTGSEGIFQVAFPNYVVRMFVRGGGGGSAPDYWVMIKDETGVVVQQASDAEIDRALPNSQAYSQMKALYEFARRQALGVDDALDSLLTELG